MTPNLFSKSEQIEILYGKSGVDKAWFIYTYILDNAHSL